MKTPSEKEHLRMKRNNRIVCLFLSVILLLCTAFGAAGITVFAAKKGIVTGDGVRIRKEPNTQSDKLGTLYLNNEVTINGDPVKGQSITDSGKTTNLWYNITYGSVTGYICGLYLSEKEDPEYIYNKTFEELIAAFPESYRDALRTLHAQYPNWKFYADNIDMTLDEAVELELGSKVTDYKNISWRSMDKGSYDWGSGKWVSKENGRWYYVSREVIKYYMDSRNFLNAEYIYTYLQQTYNPAHQTKDGLRRIISGTFLENGYDGDGDAYVRDIMTAAVESGVNPYVLAGTIIQEQGTGSSALISGASGYYNFFNIGANGENPTANGLARAKLEKWDTRSKSIIGGAKFCANGYLNAGQNTFFYLNYNIKEPDRIWHQYATAVHDSCSKGYNLSKNYAQLKTAELDFIIPVYKNMSGAASVLPKKNDSYNNYYFNSVSVSGLTPSFSRFTYSYNLKVTGDMTVAVTLPSGASYAGAEKFALKKGDNTVVLPAKAQTGYTNNYVINVFAEKACVLTVDTSGKGTENPKPIVVMCGDANGDGKINGRDAANVQMHILGIRVLSGDAFNAADTNGDGKVNGRDAANIQMHILGIKNLT